MQFRLGPPLNSLSDAELNSGNWKPVRQLPMWALQLCYPLVGAPFAFLIWSFCTWFDPTLCIRLPSGGQLIVAMFAILLMAMFVPLIAYPGFGLTERTTLGFWPSRIMPYIYFDGDCSKRRYIFIALLPPLVLVVLPLCAAMLGGRFSSLFVFTSCFSALLLGGALLVALPVAAQLPARARVAGRGFQTFWRHHA